MFVESICDDEPLILANIREVKLSSPDYVNVDSVTAVQDFRQRIRHYEEIYETIQADGNERDSSFVQLYNVGAKVIINRIRDYRQSRIVFFLINLHIKPRSIFISRVFPPFPSPASCRGVPSSMERRRIIKAEG